MEEEILNILELEKELKRNIPSRFLNDKKNIVKICIIIAYEISCLLCNAIPYTIIVNLIVHLILRELRKDWKKLSDIHGVIVEEIRKTSDYQKCLDFYDDYIKKLADHISTFNFKTAKEIALYFDILLTHGYLSSSFKNVYHDYKYDKNYIVEILGARALSGASVCRHTSSLAADCLNELGYKAELINVKVTDNLEKFTKMADFKGLVWEHGVVGIAENASKFLYDSTSSRLCGKSIIASTELKDYISDITFTNKKQHLLINPQQYVFSKKHNSLSQIMELPLENLNEDEIFTTKKRLFELFEINQSIAYKFALENYDLVKEIARLESSICPHSDEIITSWCLKK